MAKNIVISEATRRLEAVIAANPTLNQNGWDWVRRWPGQVPEPVRCDWPTKLDGVVDEFIRCQRLFREIVERATIKRVVINSYAMKHRAEENRLPKRGVFVGFSHLCHSPESEAWVDHCSATTFDDKGYVSNGAAIAAAIDAGLDIDRTCDHNSPNCLLTLHLTDDQVRANRERYKAERAAWKKSRLAAKKGCAK